MKSILIIGIIFTATIFGAEQKSKGIKPFDPQETSENATRQFWCDVDKHGRIIRADAYGISIREFIQIMAITAGENVEIKECPDEIASVSYRDLSFVELIHLTLSSRGYEISKVNHGYCIVKKNR